MKKSATSASKPWVKGIFLFLAFFSLVSAGLPAMNPFSPTSQAAEIQHNPFPDLQTAPDEQFELARCSAGRLDSLRPFFQNHLQYPVVALEKRLQGRIWVKYTIDETGNLEDARVTRSSFWVLDSMNRSTVLPIVDGVVPEEMKEAVAAMEQEALRLLGLLEDIKPATRGGKAVKTDYAMPMLFRHPDAVAENSKSVSPPPPRPTRPANLAKPARIEILD